MMDAEVYDVVVVGGGHAGVEAALAAARMQAHTLLISQNLDQIGQMSCNPAIGGLGKSHLVMEVDALGGAMARAADHAGIQFRVLNRRKGPAVRATRAQCDRLLYKQAIQGIINEQSNLRLLQDSVVDLIMEGDKVCGVLGCLGQRILARSIVLTVGTFLGGRIHVGQQQMGGGRFGDAPALPLAERLRALPFTVGRLKTGTPPRIDRRSIDWDRLEAQPGDSPLPVFSYRGKVADHPPQLCCHITHTNAASHEVIREALHQSAMYSGNIEGSGPRYCPSIEDKVVRFAERDAHQVFIEPEGLNAYEIYPNGLSTSLPLSVQYAFIRSIKGFEQAQITRPGYAIEYDFFDPQGLQPDLQTKAVPGLFMAGQINGTTGYEEAAAQGLLAGINAARLAAGQSAWCPRRDEAYLGVMMDDLITQGTHEPYRMFTSRAEHRLLLRQDNADQRLTPVGHELGVVDAAHWQDFQAKQGRIQAEMERLRNTRLSADSIRAFTAQQNPDAVDLATLLARPGVDYATVMAASASDAVITDRWIVEHLEAELKYAGYIVKQRAELQRLAKQDQRVIPAAFDYAAITGLSAELHEKLNRVRPGNLGQASRIPGMTPAAIALISVYLSRPKAA